MKRPSQGAMTAAQIILNGSCYMETDHGTKDQRGLATLIEEQSYLVDAVEALCAMSLAAAKYSNLDQDSTPEEHAKASQAYQQARTLANTLITKLEGE